MAAKEDLKEWIVECLKQRGGSASLTDVSWHVWNNHQQALKESGDLFVTWQYVLRWAALELRKEGRLRAAEISPKGIWELA